MTRYMMTIVFVITFLMTAATATAQIEADGTFALNAAGDCVDNATKNAATPPMCACDSGYRALLNTAGEVVCAEEPTIDADGMFAMPPCPGQCPDNSHPNVAGDKCACNPGFNAQVIPLDAGELMVACNVEFVYGEARAAHAAAGHALSRIAEVEESNNDRWSQYDQWFTEEYEPRQLQQESDIADITAANEAQDETIGEHGELITALQAADEKHTSYMEETRGQVGVAQTTADRAEGRANEVAAFVNDIGRPVVGVMVGGGYLGDFAGERDVVVEDLEAEDGETTVSVGITEPGAPMVEFGAFFGILNNGRNRGGLIQLSASMSPTVRNNMVTGYTSPLRGFGLGGVISAGYISAPMTQFNVRGSVSLSVSARLLDYRWSSDYLGKRISAGPLAQLWMPFSNRFGMVLGATLRVGTLTVGGTEGDPSSVAAEVGLTASFYAGRF